MYVIAGPMTTLETEANPMNILLAMDDSYYSEIALREVAERPWPPNATIRVVSVAKFLGAPVAGVPTGGPLETSPVSAMFESRNQMLESTNDLVTRAAELLARED